MEVQGVIGEMIEASRMARAYRAVAVKMPAAEDGAMKMARKHEAKVGAWAAGLLAGAAVRAAPHQ